MWIWKLCCDVEREIIMVGNDCVAKFDYSTSLLFENLKTIKSLSKYRCVFLRLVEINKLPLEYLLNFFIDL